MDPHDFSPDAFTSDALTPDKADLARRFISALPHCRALGMQLLEFGPAWAEMALDYDPRFVGDPETGVLHGGVVTALLDTCSGASVMLHPSNAGATATIDLRIDYLRPGIGSHFELRAEVLRLGSRVATTRMEFFGPDGQLMSAGAAAYIVS